MQTLLQPISNGLKWLEEKTKWLFVAAAFLLYAGSLVVLAHKVSPLVDLNLFLVKALSNLSFPFGVILLQELLELLTAISRSTLHSTCQQFEIVALVILRSFFKDFYKLNDAVAQNVFSEPIQAALVKIVAIIAITVLIFIFKRLSQQAGNERRGATHKVVNLLKQACTLVLCSVVLVYMLGVQQKFGIMPFICLVFTGMIVLDAVFFIWSIGRSHEFDMLMFDGGLVVSLVLARFPLFAANKLSYALAIVGVGFATAALRLFVRPMELEFLGRPSEDSVSRLDVKLDSEPKALKSLTMELASFMKICRASDSAIKNVRLVCEELLASIMGHGETKEDSIDVSFAVYKKLLTITISAAGESHNPLRQGGLPASTAPADKQAGGLGIHIVRMASERLAYRREAGCNITTALMSLDNSSQSERHVVEDQSCGGK